MALPATEVNRAILFERIMGMLLISVHGSLIYIGRMLWVL